MTETRLTVQPFSKNPNFKKMLQGFEKDMMVGNMKAGLCIAKITELLGISADSDLKSEQWMEHKTPRKIFPVRRKPFVDELVVHLRLK